MKKIIIACAILFSLTASAEWAKDSDADIELSDEKCVVDVNEDGTYTMTHHRRFKALNDRGRTKLALEPIQFYPDYMSVKVKSAMTTTDGHISKVDLKSIQERSAEGAESGVNGLKELIIPFNNLKVGSSVEYQYVIKTTKSAVPGVFSMRFLYGLQFPERAGTVIINSAKKIQYAFVDPDKALDIKYNESKKKNQLTITLVKSAFKLPKEASPSLPKNLHAQVEISTGESWGAISKIMAEGYEKTLSVPALPPGLKEIADKASALKDPYDKIDKVTSELANTMTYSGNWTTIEKMFYPKSLVEIGKLKIGDCKDFATATTAILRSLGMKAEVSVVYRQGRERVASQIFAFPIDPKIPIRDIFNHAIVHVKIGDKDVWVDPTNIVSNSRFVYSDIAGSLALILSKDTKELSLIPETGLQESQLSVVKTMKINADNTVDAEGSFEVSGEYAKSIFETAIYKNEQEANDTVVYFFGGDAKDSQNFIEGLDLKTRIAQNFSGKVKTLGDKNFIKESKGKKTLFIPLSSRLGVFGVAGQQRISDFYVGPQTTEKFVIKFPGYDFSKDDVGCYALTPWYSVERKLIKTTAGFELHDTVNYKQSLIKAAEINTDKYQFNLDDIVDCGGAQRIEISALKPDESLATRMKDFNKTTINKLIESSGPESISKVREAKNKVDTLLALEPTSKDARLGLHRTIVRINFKRSDIDRAEYNKLGTEVLDKLYQEYPKDGEVLRYKSYHGIRTKNFDEAKRFFKEAYYNSEKGLDIYVLGGYLGLKTKDYKVAEGAYKKALEYAKDPKDISELYSELAEIAGNQDQWDVMLGYYKKAIEYDASNAWLFSRYVQYLNFLKKWDEAIVAGERMLKIADFGVGRDLLGQAYSGKAKEIWDGYLHRPQRTVSDPEQDVVSEMCMKALKYRKSDYSCLNFLGMFAINTARVENKLEAAQKAYGYFSRALQVPGRENQAGTLRLQAEAKQIVSRLQEPSRAPASVGQGLPGK